MKPTPRLVEISARRVTPPVTYTLDDAAALFGVHRNTLSRWIERGELASYRQGRLRYVSRQAIEEYVARKHAAAEEERQQQAARLNSVPEHVRRHIV